MPILFYTVSYIHVKNLCPNIIVIKEMVEMINKQNSQVTINIYEMGFKYIGACINCETVIPWYEQKEYPQTKTPSKQEWRLRLKKIKAYVARNLSLSTSLFILSFQLRKVKQNSFIYRRWKLVIPSVIWLIIFILFSSGLLPYRIQDY